MSQFLKDIVEAPDYSLARMFHETQSRDPEDGRTTWQPQELESEAYFNRTPQDSTSEDARKGGHVHGRSPP